MSIEIRPLSDAYWPHLEDLFGPRGGCAGCWCMYWRRRAREYEAGKGEGNRNALREVVASGGPVGVLALREERALGWCAVAPRADFVRLETSRILRPVDGAPVWAIVCLFVHRAERRKGLSVELIRGACEYARSRGATEIEAYPVEPREAKAPDAFVWTGLRSAYDRVGFREVARRSPTRPIMRWAPSPDAGRRPKEGTGAGR